MDFYMIHPIDIDSVTLIPRPDLDLDGSFTAFDIVGGIDTRDLLAEECSRFTIFKFPNGVVLLQIKCKYSPKPRARCHTIKTYGVCTQEEAAAMNELYSKSIRAAAHGLLTSEIGGEWYDEIFSRCHPFASSSRRA